MDQFLTRFSSEGREPRQDISVEVLVPPKFIAKRLDLAPDELAVVRRRLRFLDGRPSQVNDTYFPHGVVKDSEIVDPRDISRGALRVLVDLGYEQARLLDETWIRMPSAEETDRLSLQSGTPVAEHIRTGYTSEGKPIRCAVTVLPGDVYVIAHEFDVPEDWE
ncbi:UTRA domain-containing protein [Nocardiopsis sp. CNT-189]|uniref:UTRA domain-containing protein n=1 Tax=Nocardiopsis oceanisediminis TaxID=2816862 RepID=UPI003B3B44D8